MLYPPVCRALLRHVRWLPPAGWLWCALAVVCTCDTNVLARVLTGQVAAAPGEWPGWPEEDGDERDCDSDDASATPTLTTAPSLGRPFGVAPPARVPADPPAGRPRPGGPGFDLGLLTPTVPLLGGGGFPLLC
jgi:hypothetical protein